MLHRPAEELDRLDGLIDKAFTSGEIDFYPKYTGTMLTVVLRAGVARGLVGVKERYGISDVDFVPFAGLSPYQALDQGEVDVAAIFSTDPPLASGKYVVLEDTEANFGFQNVAPVVKQELADELGDDFRETVDAVSEQLTDEAIIAMNSAVAIDQRPAAEVAREFLEANDVT